MSENTRVAVLIDCDNISSKMAKEVLAETAKHGTLSIKRGYGDWGSGNLKSWRAELGKHAIQPVQQIAHVSGKNATDTALIIDAMDLLYSDNVEAFCIVSSDSDFTRLAMRLRESGKRVYGIGSRKTPEVFTNACDRFTFTEVLLGESVAPIVGGEAEQAVGNQDERNVPDFATQPQPADELEGVPTAAWNRRSRIFRTCLYPLLRLQPMRKAGLSWRPLAGTS